MRPTTTLPQAAASPCLPGKQGSLTIFRFLFGLKGDVQNNLFYYDDQRVIYPAGHNVVVYNVDEKTQQYISGKVTQI